MTLSRLRPLLLPAFATLCMGALLIGLGVWQLKRLAWKEAIIANIEARTKAPPQPIPSPASWTGLKPNAYAYQHVTVAGTFENDKETLIFRASDDGAGYLVMTPLRLRGGGIVLVNRGFVPSELRDPAKRAAGQPTGLVHVTGLMREPEARNLFTPADEPGTKTYFTRDPGLVAARLGLHDAAPFSIDADAAPNPGGWPRGGATQLSIPNNHFSYAMTWFGLALSLVCVFVSFAWKQLALDDEAPIPPAPASAPTTKRLTT